MSNRRMGGMGGLNRGNNRSFSQQPFQGGLNPWQGGGPMQPNQGGGLLSQLTANPQQLALALTSLLQSPQQHQMNPPSLLSLNTAPAFSNQNRDFNDRFGNRGRDIRRHEPYNKNRPSGGWRPMDRGGNRNNIQRNQGNKRRSPQRDNRKDDKNKKDEKDKKENKAVEKKKTDKDKESGADTIDLSMDEDKEDGKETKRAWKDEKNQSEDKKSENGDEDDSEDKDKNAKNKEGKYSGVPIKFLNCFVCNKEMWDGESMWKHVRGRAHSQMLKSLEESIHITVNILRENMRLSEEKKSIERNRMHRLKKFNKFNEELESSCNMCDLKFIGKIIAHRRTVGHQRLKRYLHPDCRICDKEFPSRMDWIEHRLTPEHLKKFSEDVEAKIGGNNGMDIFKSEEENLEPLLEEALQMEVENPVLEVDDNLENLQNLMPAYKRDRAIATKSLKPFTGFMCELCNRSFPTEDIAQAHLKTLKHYHTFVGVIKDKHKRDLIKKDKKEEKENVKAEETKDKKEEPDQNMYDPEEATNEENEEAEEEEEEEEESKVNATVNNSTAKEEDEEEEEETTGDPSSISLNNSQLAEDEEDVEMVEQENDVKKEEEILKSDEETKVEAKKPKVEPVKKEEPVTPAKARPVRGNVKNGAGPKSKKMAVAAATKEPETPADPANYRIPKVAPTKTVAKKK